VYTAVYGPYRLVYTAMYGPSARPFSAVYTGRVHCPCTLPFSAVYVARTWPCNGPCTRPLHGRVQGSFGPYIRQVGLPGRIHVPRRHATAVCGPLRHTVRVHGPCRRTCTRLCMGHVHDRVHGTLRPCTRPTVAIILTYMWCKQSQMRTNTYPLCVKKTI